ncbi:MAG TPA: hypothetical protein VGN13_07085 [Solirubrobacteraceae bacterium]
MALGLVAAMLSLMAFGAGNAIGEEPPAACPNSTLSGFSPALPDCRAYELVSNPIDETYVPGADGEATGGGGKNTTGEYTSGDSVRNELPFQAALAGEKLAFVGGESNSGEGGNGDTSDGFGNQYVAVRDPSGWRASNVSLATGGIVALATSGVFSPDLSLRTVEALLSTPAERVSASPEVAPECVENQLASTYSQTAGGLHALITAIRPGSFECDAWPAAISADDSHILLDSRGAYTLGAAEGSDERHRNLYDSVGGSLHQVNVLPSGEAEQSPGATFGATLLFNTHTWSNFDGALSPDGSRVAWSSLGEEYRAPKALYVRENDAQPQSPVVEGRCTVAGDACTVQLDATQGGTGASGGGFFWGANQGGSKVFFTDCSRLTADSTANSEKACLHEPLTPGGRESPFEGGAVLTGSDLYEYDFERPVGQRVVDLTVDHNPGDTLGADVQGVIGVSQDGADVYFVANGVLAGANIEGRVPVSGQPNLYLAHGATTTFVATLAPLDNNTNTRDESEIGGPNSGSSQLPPLADWAPPVGFRTAQVSSDGGAVAFESREHLTGYDSMGLPEVFVYQAGSGRLACASCDPSGEPPNLSLGRRPTDTQLLGGFVAVSGRPSFQPRWLVEREGLQAYFMTSQALVPSDRNGLQDVYEWESDGSGHCSQPAGCLSLVSDAGTLSNSYFIESGGGGRDVFLTTRSQLTPSGSGETLKLYDARVDGGFSETSQACTGTGCQGVPPAPPAFSTPSSTTFGGAGNYPPVSSGTASKPKPKPAQCKRGAFRKHGRCVRRKAACRRGAHKSRGRCVRGGARHARRAVNVGSRGGN